MTKELPTQDEILERRTKEISDKAAAEEKRTSIYKGLSDKYTALSEQYSQNVERVVTEAFIDHFKSNDFKTEGFGNKVYSTIDSYFKKELVDCVPEQNGLARAVLEGYKAQMEEDKEQLLDFIKSEDKLSLGMVAQIGNFFSDKAESPIKSAHMAEVKRNASSDLDGFKKYLKETAEEAGLPFNMEKVTNVDIGLKRYMSLTEAIKKKKKEEEMLKKRFE